MAQTFGRRRQIDRYDGQTIFIGSQVAYELGNYLGGGASGSVYQALDVTSHNPQEKSVAIKILKPLGYKILPYGQLAKCIVASKGQPLNQKQIHGKAPLTADNLWWLVQPTSEHVYAAYEDASRGQLRELTLPRCIEIWGWAPLGSEQLSPDVVEKRNNSGQSFVVSNTCIVQLPIVAPKYLRWLQSRATICREMNNMIHIGEHPNIVDLLEVLELIQDSKAVLFLVLEFVNGGELFDRMKRSSGPGTPSDEFARRYFSQLLSGIDYCHCKGVVHRDLKPENLLLSDPSESAILKIADFGLSAVVFATEGVDPTFFPSQSSPSPNYFSPGGNDRDQDFLSVTGMALEGHPHVHFNQQQSPIQILHSPTATHKQNFPGTINTPSPVPLRRLRSVVGSPHYIAPEIVNHDDPCGYDGRKVDMWSAGVILYSLLTGSLPFGGDLSSCPRYKLYKQWMLSEYGPAVREGRSRDVVLPVWFFPPSISPIAGSLILQLIHVDPQQRCTASEALRHPWSTGEGSKPAFSDPSARSHPKGVKLQHPDDPSPLVSNVTSPIAPNLEREKDKNKGIKCSNKEQKEKRISAPPSPVVMAGIPPPLPSAVRSTKPPRSPPSAVYAVPTVPASNHSAGSPGSSSPTLVSLVCVATALAPYSTDVIRSPELAIEEIIITEDTPRSSSHRELVVQQQFQLDELRCASDDTLAAWRSDMAPKTVVGSNCQAVTRTRPPQGNSQQPAYINSETVIATNITSCPATAPFHSRFPGRHTFPAAVSTTDSGRSRSDVHSNQVQEGGNSPRYSMRGEQSRPAQDREEEGRKERYQSILEQQRQKEAAALAMEIQPDQGHGHGHTAYMVASANPNPSPNLNRDSGSAEMAILLSASEASGISSSDSVFVCNENDSVAAEIRGVPS